MRKMGLAWGVAAVVYGLAAQAAPKNAAPAANGTAGAAAAPSSSAAGTPSAPATPSAAPTDPDAPAAPGVPADGAAPAAPEAQPAPAPPSAAEQEAREEEEEEEAREAARRKRKRRRQLELEAEEEEDVREPLAPAKPPEHWRLIGPHLMLSAERLTNVLTWTLTRNVSLEGNSFGPNSIDLERAGTDVSFLGSGGVSANVFGIPRFAIDGMFANGLTLGGSLSYMVTSGEHENVDFSGGSSGTSKTKAQDPTNSIFILAPRLGVMIPASPFVAVWLRGGISRIAISTEDQLSEAQTGAVTTSTVTSTVTLVNLTLDPQLVITPVPRVGITLGALLDIGVGGTSESSISSATHDVKESAYGVTGGLVAIF